MLSYDVYYYASQICKYTITPYRTAATHDEQPQ